MFKKPVWLPNSTSDAVLYTVYQAGILVSQASWSARRPDQPGCISVKCHEDVELGNSDCKKLEGQECPLQEIAENTL